MSGFAYETAGVPQPRPKQFGKPRPTGAPVRRYSAAADVMSWFFRPLDQGLKGAILAFADFLKTLDVEFGSAWGKLTAKQADIYKFLVKKLNWKTGWLCPSYEEIARETPCTSETVSTALDRFEALGIVFRQRRYVEAEGETFRGKAVRQTTNAYRLAFPPALLKRFGRRGDCLKDIKPDDWEHARLTAEAANAADDEIVESERKAQNAKRLDARIARASAFNARKAAERAARGDDAQRSAAPKPWPHRQPDDLPPPDQPAARKAAMAARYATYQAGLEQAHLSDSSE